MNDTLQVYFVTVAKYDVDIKFCNFLCQFTINSLVVVTTWWTCNKTVVINDLMRHFEQQIKNTRKGLQCDSGEGWRCEKWRSITKNQRGEKYSTNDKNKEV